MFICYRLVKIWLADLVFVPAHQSAFLSEELPYRSKLKPSLPRGRSQIRTFEERIIYDNSRIEYFSSRMLKLNKHFSKVCVNIFNILQNIVAFSRKNLTNPILRFFQDFC